MKTKNEDEDLTRLEQLWPYLTRSHKQELLCEVRKGAALAEFKQLVNGETGPHALAVAYPAAHWI